MTGNNTFFETDQNQKDKYNATAKKPVIPLRLKNHFKIN
ncbi:hypothetical protein BQ1740_3176 [Bacillus subtilis]|nr:hypothetical protein BQ1740_3176 [Bacillus subtilis]